MSPRVVSGRVAGVVLTALAASLLVPGVTAQAVALRSPANLPHRLAPPSAAASGRAAAAGPGGGGAPSTTAPQPRDAGTSTPALAASGASAKSASGVAYVPPLARSTSASLGWGVAEPDWPGSTAGLLAAENVAGRTANLVMVYAHWTGTWSTIADWLPDITLTLQNGSTPVITWMSDDVDLRSIAAGTSDAFVRSWADGIRSAGHTVLIRFDDEMNGNWMQYSPGYGGNGTTAADFVAAWRHVHDVFAAERATNARWIWAPNVENTGSAPLAPLYPGDAYVDWVALDGYNWGTTYGHVWQSFSSVFNASIKAVESLTRRPFMISEVASTEVGGDKAAWVSDMFKQLASRRDIHGFIWFDYDKETDWRIASSATSAAAFASGMATYSAP